MKKKIITFLLRSFHNFLQNTFSRRARDQTDEVYAETFHLFSLTSLSKHACLLIRSVWEDPGRLKYPTYNV